MIGSDWNQIYEEQNNKTIVLENIMSEKWFRFLLNDIIGTEKHEPKF
jgi:hypothetical protein